MASVKVNQLNSHSRGPKQAYLNVQEESWFVEVNGTVFEKETYLITDGIHFSLVQFDGNTSQEGIREYFEGRHGNWRAIKIEKDTLVMDVSPS
jgi:hypothetical protein